MDAEVKGSVNIKKGIAKMMLFIFECLDRADPDSKTSYVDVTSADKFYGAYKTFVGIVLIAFASYLLEEFLDLLYRKHDEWEKKRWEKKRKKK